MSSSPLLEKSRRTRPWSPAQNLLCVLICAARSLLALTATILDVEILCGFESARFCFVCRYFERIEIAAVFCLKEIKSFVNIVGGGGESLSCMESSLNSEVCLMFVDCLCLQR